MELTAEWTIPVGGSWPLEFRFKDDDLPSGMHIDSATKTVSPATGLTVTDPVVNSGTDGFTFTATAVTAGGYSILFAATRSDGGINIVLGHIEVTAASDRTSLAANALITLADFRGFMKDESIGKNIAETIINSVSQAFASEADPDFLPSTAVVETINGNGKSYLYVSRYPITDIDSVVEDGVTLTEDVDYFADYDEGLLEKATTGWPTYGAAGKWTTARGGVVITYDVGYATVPSDVKLACLIEVARKFTIIQQGMFGMSSKALEGVTVNINTDELLPETLATLARYTRTRI
jgi:hypothetical protein